MKTYGIDNSVREFKQPWGNLWATEVGAPGGYHVIVAVQSSNGEPSPNRWGVVPTQTGRPAIRANADGHEEWMSLFKDGWLARFSTYTGASKAVGRIMAPDNAIDCIFVVALGTVKSEDAEYEEVIVAAPIGCELYLRDTVSPGRIVQFLPEEILIRQHDLAHLPKNHISDERILNWRRKYGPPKKTNSIDARTACNHS